jgi:hypothetical protein
VGKLRGCGVGAGCAVCIPIERIETGKTRHIGRKEELGVRSEDSEVPARPP